LKQTYERRALFADFAFIVAEAAKLTAGASSGICQRLAWDDDVDRVKLQESFDDRCTDE
jgi:hypothetical protein